MEHSKEKSFTAVSKQIEALWTWVMILFVSNKAQTKFDDGKEPGWSSLREWLKSKLLCTMVWESKSDVIYQRNAKK